MEILYVGTHTCQGLIFEENRPDTIEFYTMNSSQHFFNKKILENLIVSHPRLLEYAGPLMVLYQPNLQILLPSSVENSKSNEMIFDMWGIKNDNSNEWFQISHILSEDTGLKTNFLIPSTLYHFINRSFSVPPIKWCYEYLIRKYIATNIQCRTGLVSIYICTMDAHALIVVLNKFNRVLLTPCFKLTENINDLVFFISILNRCVIKANPNDIRVFFEGNNIHQNLAERLLELGFKAAPYIPNSNNSLFNCLKENEEIIPAISAFFY